MDEPQKKEIKDIVKVVVKELKKSNLLKDEKMQYIARYQRDCIHIIEQGKMQS